MINRIRGEHANHYTTDAVFFLLIGDLESTYYFTRINKKNVTEMNYPETQATDGHWAHVYPRTVLSVS
jgi:hypothetical protein